MLIISYSRKAGIGNHIQSITQSDHPLPTIYFGLNENWLINYSNIGHFAIIVSAKNMI
jgi:hypothetical protein